MKKILKKLKEFFTEIKYEVEEYTWEDFPNIYGKPSAIHTSYVIRKKTWYSKSYVSFKGTFPDHGLIEFTTREDSTHFETLELAQSKLNAMLANPNAFLIWQ